MCLPKAVAVQPYHLSQKIALMACMRDVKHPGLWANDWRMIALCATHAQTV